MDAGGGQPGAPSRPTSTTTRAVDTSIFHDKEYLTVDNYPGDAHYGRVYVTWTKFHIRDDGLQRLLQPQILRHDQRRRTRADHGVQAHSPDPAGRPGIRHRRLSANQFFVPVVEKGGTLDVGFLTEEHNDASTTTSCSNAPPTAAGRSCPRHPDRQGG